MRRAVAHLLKGDVAGVREAYADAALRLRRRATTTHDVSARVRLTKSPADYLATRGARRGLPYEALLGAGRTTWCVGERVRIYRATNNRAGLLVLPDDECGGEAASDPRDYDADHYLRVLRAAEDFATVFANPEQPSLFARPLSEVKAILAVVDEEPARFSA